jgi:hypothetical protein
MKSCNLNWKILHRRILMQRREELEEEHQELKERKRERTRAKKLGSANFRKCL